MKPEIEYLPVTPKSIGDWVVKKGTERKGAILGTHGEYITVLWDLWDRQQKPEKIHGSELRWY